MRVREANIEEADHLSELAVRSKAYWGYDDSFMRDAVEDLTLNPEHIERGMVFLAEDDGKVLGYYAFCVDEEPEMIALFVEPNQIGKGVGLSLWQHSLKFAVNKGWTKFKVVADPFAAEKFYLKVGCKKVGEYQSPVRKDRKLPLLEYDLSKGSSQVSELYHVSENPNIEEFIPLPPPNKDAGIEVDAVWAITDYELANYLLPRDCPRVCYRDNENQKIIAIEEGWVERINNTTVYLYTFDPSTFIEIDPVAGYWISKKAVKPRAVIEFDNILQRLPEKGVNLKVLPHLHDERNKVVECYKHFSIIRFRNALNPGSRRQNA